MNKPTTVARQEFIEKIIEDINASELPFFIIEPILKDLLESIQRGAKEQFEKDLATYREYLKNKEDENVPSETLGDSKPPETEG